MSAPDQSGFGLCRALLAGGQRVISQRDAINRINVWPVADHDTGTNLAATLGAVLVGLRELRRAGAGAVLRRAAGEAGDGARGNAGAILSQFFHGAAEALADNPRLTLPALAVAAAHGSTLARAAMADPQEGTMLTVIQAFADELRIQAEAGIRDCRAGFAAALARTRAALPETRRQLPALRAAGVVDAGARGFVSLLEGIGEFIERGRAAPVATVPAELVAAGVDAARGAGADHRYCVECAIAAPRVDRAGLKAALQALPLSGQVITGTRAQTRLHAHVDDPAPLLALAARFGALSRERIEDLGQADGGRRRRVAIATDSGADLPAEELVRLDIHVVPQRLSVDECDHIDGVTISTDEFYHAMRTSPVPPRTSQPPPGDFRRMFEHLLGHHESVVEVSLARTLSGTLQSAESAAARAGPGRVHVFDTGSVAAGQALLVLWAAEAAQAGLDARRILDGLARMKPRTSVHAVVGDIQYAVRGGRAPKVALTLTRLLRFALTLEIRPNGRLGLAGGLWGRRNRPERFARSVVRRMDPARRYRVIVGHCDCPAAAARVRDTLLAGGRTIERLWVVETGVAIGAHAGPDTLVIGIQDYEPPAP
jgi:hypothetical protein